MSFNNLDTLYRQVIMDHYKNPRNKGSLEGDILTVDMNNPTCGDRIQLQLQVEDGIVKDAKFQGEGCSISMASASMMTQAIKGKKIEDAMKMSTMFSQMMLGEEVDEEGIDLGDIQALQGVSKFPARIKCATLSWKAMEKGVNEG
ncbi:MULTISPECIES: Fe-S cluster assembly sulfur transfer protein SufU [Virgibacillus]|uniref:NifU-like protein n=2 Tax=Virgibacillus TaxID=84406 RepID=A0A024QAB6_9BACI|nr:MULTISPECIES: SUF system NifU family Fe-S cluster assembly protein [Virgibacillus]EQB37342.1 nitrogen-fixing protein NifU [Virgibacillus sp. CM-4]MYL40096.1 SUF system NifU family Fe-S cluster assembly protein [Virgibacillus massiliensis]GGJ61689.1 iron-sulfur cluster assembly scaffold protein NifU [Virgibacillus kapii]CDQ39160.1 NifU-like protein [Virgibacillus massiliensis]